MLPWALLVNLGKQMDPRVLKISDEATVRRLGKGDYDRIDPSTRNQQGAAFCDGSLLRQGQPCCTQIALTYARPLHVLHRLVGWQYLQLDDKIGTSEVADKMSLRVGLFACLGHYGDEQVEKHNLNRRVEGGTNILEVNWRGTISR